jgi:transposase
MGRDLALERAWRDRLRRFERSGLTVREFCEQEGLVAHQFFWWRRELKRRRAESAKKRGTTRRTGRTKRGRKRDSAAAGTFVPVEVAPPSPSKAPIEIVVDRPLRIAVSSGFDPHLLADVIRTLEGRQC